MKTARDHVATLRMLRKMYVEARRGRAADAVRHNLPAGNEKRLCEIQEAINAVDAAIKDEAALALLLEEEAEMMEGLAVASTGNGMHHPQAANGRYNGKTETPEHAGWNGGDAVAERREPTWCSYDAWLNSGKTTSSAQAAKHAGG
jgi:hypothetical protein